MDISKKIKYMILYRFKSFLPILFIILLVSCQNKDQSNSKLHTIDFSVVDTQVQGNNNFNDTSRSLSVAVAAIISPKETFIYYSDLLDYISEKLGRPIEMTQRKTYQEINNMIKEGKVDMAFICSGAYTLLKNKDAAEILVVPVCNGKPFYQAYIITNKLSGINTFEELRGKSFAFTDPLSNTGKLYADKRLHELGVSSESFFASTTYTHAHDLSIQLVSKMLIDGATVDGLIYEYVATFYPERVKNIKIIEKSNYLGIPPVVVTSALDSTLKEELRSIMLTIHEDSVGNAILKKLLIEKFVEGEDGNYNEIRAMQNLN